MITARRLLREPGLVLSSVAHIALLGTALYSVSGTDLPPLEEGIAVEMITDAEFTEITRGEEDATEVAEIPAPRAERVAEVEELRAPGEDARDTETPATRPPEVEVAERPVAAAAEPPPPPPPPPPPRAPVEAAAPAPVPPAPAPEPTPDTPAPLPPQIAAPAETEAPEAAPAPPIALPPSRSERAAAQADARRLMAAEAERRRTEEAEQQAGADAERRRREEQDRAELARLADAARTEPPRAAPVAEEAPRFDPSSIASLLRSTEDARSTGASADRVNDTASLGTQTGTAARLSPTLQSQLIGIIQSQLRACWDVPIAAQALSNPPVAAVRMSLAPDGALVGEPQVTNASADPLFGAVAESALRATRRCTPLRIPATFDAYYEEWKTLTVNFNPLYS